jgi:predicted aconitase with swiveling domain
MAPAALIISRTDPFLALAAVVADVQYGVTLPVIQISEGEFEQLLDGASAQIEASGRISLGDAP